MCPLASIADIERYPLAEGDFRASCRAALAETGALVMPGFLLPEATESVRREGEAKRDAAYFCTQSHNIYLTPPDPDYAGDHIRNLEVISSKGCITDDQISETSVLRQLYDDEAFRTFLCAVLDEVELFAYADPLSSINLNYAEPGQELGWHFDNSSFSITLMIQAPERGGTFEYVKAARNSDTGDRGFATVRRVLDGTTQPQHLTMEPGTLVLFRGRNALHRVAPVEGTLTRILAVLAYNSQPDIALSESARMTFFGRLG